MGQISGIITFFPNTIISSSDANSNNTNIVTVYNAHDAATSNIHGATGSVVGTTNTQTLTNKTLTSPTITGGTLSSPVLTTPQINDTSSDHQYVFAVNELAADRTVTLPLLTGNDTFVFQAHAQPLSNKTLLSPIVTDGSLTINGDTVPQLVLTDSGTSGTPRIVAGDSSSTTQGIIKYNNTGDYWGISVNGNSDQVLSIKSSGIEVQSNTSSNTIVRMQSPTGVGGDDFQFEIGNDTLEFNANGATTGFFEAETSGQHTFTINNRGADIDTVIKTDASSDAFFVDAGNDEISISVPVLFRTISGTPKANYAYREAIPKGWANFVVTSASTGNLQSSYNVSSLSVTSSVATINWDRDFSSTNYVVSGNASSGSSDKVFLTFGLSTTDVACRAYDAAGSLATTFYGTLMAIGAQ